MDADPRLQESPAFDPACPRTVLPGQFGPTHDETPDFFVYFERNGQLLVLTTPTTHEHYFASCAAPT